MTYLVDCLKNVKVCPSYVYCPLKILYFVVPTGCTIALNLQHKLESLLLYIPLNRKWQCDVVLEFIVFSCGTEVLFVIFP